MPQLYALLLVQKVEPVGGQTPEWIERYIGGCKVARARQPRLLGQKGVAQHPVVPEPELQRRQASRRVPSP